MLQEIVTNQMKKNLLQLPILALNTLLDLVVKLCYGHDITSSMVSNNELGCDNVCFDLTVSGCDSYRGRPLLEGTVHGCGHHCRFETIDSC